MPVVDIPQRLFADEDIDLNTVKGMDWEQYFLYYPRVDIFRVKSEGRDSGTNTPGTTSNLYGAPKSNKLDMEGPVAAQMPVYVNMEPERQEIDRWGLDIKEDGIAVVSVAVGEHFQYEPKIGDRFVFRGRSYEVRTVKPDGFFNNTDKFVHWACIFNKNKTNRAVNEATPGAL